MASPKKTTSTNAKKTAGLPAAPAAEPVSSKRQLRPKPKHRLFRSRQVKRPVRLPNVLRISQKSLCALWRHHWLFLGLAIIYAVLSISSLINGVDGRQLKQEFTGILGSNATQASVSFSVFASLLASSGNSTNAAGGAYQILLIIVISLATIWILRQTAAGEAVRLRDAFYKGMYPLIPFILVLVVIFLQLVPFLIGGELYSVAVSNGIATTLPEQAMWGLLFLVLAFVSVYMLCSSLFALYIVTLPDMTPMKALRSARQLVRYRRAAVFRKIAFMLLVLFALAAGIVIPVIAFVPLLAQWVFFVVSTFALILVNAYMYTLYRELLVE